MSRTDPPSRATFPATVRLRKRPEFLAVQNQGRKVHSDSFVIFVLPRLAPATVPKSTAAGSDGGGRRVGITVSRKVGNAVVRNRVKRLVREVWRRRRLSFPVGYDIVFVAKKAVVDRTYARVDQEIEKLCARHFARL